MTQQEYENKIKDLEKQIEYTARYKNYIEEHSGPLDWNNSNEYKYCVGFSFENNQIGIVRAWSHKNLGVIYASSEQIIKDAIKEIGKDNFKKYVLGVK